MAVTRVKILPNTSKDNAAVNCDEHIPWFLRNMILNYPPMERLVDYLVDQMPDKQRFNLARQLEQCKSSGDLSLMRTYGIDETDIDPMAFLQELSDKINPSRMGSVVNDLIQGTMTGNGYRSFMTALLPLAFGSPGTSFYVHPRVRALGTMLELDEKEMKFLTFAYCSAHDGDFFRLANSQESTRQIHDIAILLDLEPTSLRRMISDTAPLIRYGIIDKDTNRQGTRMELDQSIDEYLSGYSDTPYCADLQDLREARFSLNSFPVSREECDLLLSLLRSNEPHHLLIYGVPGTGKTEFMHSLLAASDRSAKILRFNESMRNSQGRIVSLSTVSKMLAPAGTVLVIDEADSIINTQSGGFSLFGRIENSTEQFGKEWLNLFLDETKATTIWISNNVSRMHDSVKRRFATSVFFEETSLTHRRRIWSALAQEYGLADFASESQSIRLIQGYRPSPADMETALKLVRTVPAANRLSRLELSLNSRRTLEQGMVTRPKLDDLVECYDPAILNTDTTPDELLKSINQALVTQRNLCLLFHGSPGTGKTELAKYLSRECGRSLLVKRSSDLLNPFVGMTEKLIASMFREAERDGSILLLDEADSLLRSRDKARHSWEVTQTNELLTQMENYRGVMIACTNLIDSMDGAVLRRFAWKVHFLPLNFDQRIRLFEKWFSGAVINETTKSRLHGISLLSPGDYKAVAGRLSQDRQRDASYIVEQLEQESRYRVPEGGANHKIGFGA